MRELVRATLEAASVNAEKGHRESRTDKETTSAINDSIARCRLMFASIAEEPDPNDPQKTVQTVHLP
jgi:hypothetical protein